MYITKHVRVEAEMYKVSTNVYHPEVNFTRECGFQGSHAFISVCI